MLEYLSSLPGAIALGLIWTVLALGVYITYKVLNIADLTVDGSFVTGAMVAAVLITSGVHFILAILIAFLAGALCGFITGILHTALGIPAILAGILTQMMLWSINLIIGGSNISIANVARIFSQDNIGDALWKIGIIVVLIVAILYIFFGTELGASIRATGNNQDMSRAQGINTKFNIVLGLMISNGLVALSGALLAQYQGYADINMGKGAIVIGLCAVVIGTPIVNKISPNFFVRLLGSAVGGLIYFIIYQTVVFLGIDTRLLKMLAAVLVVIFLGIPYIRKTHGEKIRKMLKNRKIKGGEVND